MIKVDFVESKKVPVTRDYPYIGTYGSDVTVLFVGPNKGIALVHCNMDFKTKVTEAWVESAFMPIKKITVAKG